MDGVRAMKRILSALLVVLVLSFTVSATGTVTVTTVETIPGTIIYSLAWTSHTDGTVTGNVSSTWGSTTYPGRLHYPIEGRLAQVKFIPNTGGTQPTNLYDVTIVDSDGASLLVIDSVDYGANLSNAAPQVNVLHPPVHLDGTKTLDVRVAAAGSGKTGIVQLWVVKVS